MLSWLHLLQYSLLLLLTNVFIVSFDKTVNHLVVIGCVHMQVPTFSGSVEWRIERHPLAVVLPQHFPVDLIGARVHRQHQVEVRPQPLGDPAEAVLEVGPELRGPLWVWLHQSLEPGPHIRLQSQSAADLPPLDVLHELLPAILRDGEEMG